MQHMALRFLMVTFRFNDIHLHSKFQITLWWTTLFFFLIKFRVSSIIHEWKIQRDLTASKYIYLQSNYTENWSPGRNIKHELLNRYTTVTKIIFWRKPATVHRHARM